MASLRSIAWILLLLAALCSTVLALSSVANGQDDNNIKVISMGDLGSHGYSLLNQPAPLPVAVTPSNKAAAASPDVITVQSSFTNFFSENYNRIQVPLSWQRVIAGGVLLAVGLVLTIFGFRYLRFSLLLTGFIGGAIAAFAILTNTEPAGLWSNRILIYVAVCIAAGLLIGLLMLAANKYASWILGGAGGLALGVYILSWREGGLIHNTAGRIGLMAGAAALGILLSTFLGSLTVIFATVLIGGYMFTLGLDMFLRTGFLENYKYLFRTGNSVPYQIYSGIYGMLGVLSLMFLIGYLFQIPLYFNYKRNQRAIARADAVPAVNSPYGDGYRDSKRDSRYRDSNYRDSQYRDSQYRDSQYRDSHYGGSQYGSRDQLNTTYGNNQVAPVKKEYNWWGKRINKDANQGGYNNEKYNYQGQSVQGQHVPQQQQQVYQQQPYQQQAYQPQPVIQQQPVAIQQPSVVQAQQQPSVVQAQQQPSVVQAQQQPVAVQHLGSSTTSVGGDKTVVFEEKKNWFGRTKIVPKIADAASSSGSSSNVLATATTTPTATSSTPAAVV